jgi:nitrous oxidase accessory protein NosD
MTIHAGGRAIIIAGAGNTIRNSVLEVDGDTSVLSYGPDTIIEGNTFIIHLDKKNPKGELPAALKLRHANRAIVRNNKFIVKKGLFNSSTAEFAINLSDSKDVLIEGNTIEGFDKLVRKNGDTNFIDQNNVLK